MKKSVSFIVFLALAGVLLFALYAAPPCKDGGFIGSHCALLEYAKNQLHDVKINFITSNTNISDMVQYVWHMDERPKNASMATVIHEQSQKCNAAVHRPKPENVIIRNTYWQLFENPPDEILLYSAIFDDRPIVGPSPFIRITALVRPSENVGKFVNNLWVPAEIPGAYFCQVWYPGINRPYIVEIVVEKGGNSWYSGWTGLAPVIISCVLPSTYPVPSHVSITYGQCANPSLYLPIYANPSDDWVHEFGMCVAASFGTIPNEQFVEWVEFHRMMGVGEFHIYNGSMASDIRPVLDYYEQKGVLRVHGLGSPLPTVGYYAIMTASYLAMNDCLMRNMFRFRYLIVLDLDEFIVPNENVNYTQLLTLIDAAMNLSHPWTGYGFRNTFHFLEGPNDVTQPQFLRLMRFRYRQTTRPFGQRTKSFTDPRRCFLVFHHYCLTWFPGTEDPSLIDVPVSLAMTHHYRARPSTNNDLPIKDPTDFMLRYKSELVGRVSCVLNETANK